MKQRKESDLYKRVSKKNIELFFTRVEFYVKVIFLYWRSLRLKRLYKSPSLCMEQLKYFRIFYQIFLFCLIYSDPCNFFYILADINSVLYSGLNLNLHFILFYKNTLLSGIFLIYILYSDKKKQVVDGV